MIFTRARVSLALLSLREMGDYTLSILLGSGTNLLKTGNSKTPSANDKSWEVDAEGGEGQWSWLRDPTKVIIVGYEVQQKYNSTPVSIQDKLSFCHRAPMGTENGKFNAVFLNLATEYVQYIIRFILKATQTLDTCAYVLLYLLNCKKTSVEWIQWFTWSFCWSYELFACSLVPRPSSSALLSDVTAHRGVKDWPSRN